MAMGRIIPHTPGGWRARAGGGGLASGLGTEGDGSKASTRPQGQRETNLPVMQSDEVAEISPKKACRVNGPSPRHRRQNGIQREICRIVPEADPQACCANDCGSWAFLRSWKLAEPVWLVDVWSGRTDSNPRPQPWQSCLPRRHLAVRRRVRSSRTRLSRPRLADALLDAVAWVAARFGGGSSPDDCRRT